jgi:hypothetical protein
MVHMHQNAVNLAEAPLAPFVLILTDALWDAALAHAFCIYLAWAASATRRAMM